MAESVRFNTTLWTVIEGAREKDPAAVEKIIQDYSPPLLGFIRNRGFNPDDAEDLLQEVLIRIYNEDFLKKANKLKGKFRSVLLGVTKKVILKHYEKKGAIKRGGVDRTISMENLKVDDSSEIPIAGDHEDFNRMWFENLLRLALRQLAEECAQTGKHHHRVITLRLKGDAYGEIAAALEIKESDVTNTLHAAKKKLQAIARDIIANYSSSDREYESDADMFNKAVDLA